MNKEIFKATIMKQWRDPRSAFNCLLSTSEHGERVLGGGNNLSTRPISLYASEFKMRVALKWELILGNTQGLSTQVPPEIIQQVFFDDVKPSMCIDLSEPLSLETQWFLEETMVFDGNILTMGLRRFQLQHNYYSFYKKYEDGILHPCKFNASTREFDDKDYIFSHNWTKARHGNGWGEDAIYIDYIVGDVERDLLINFLKSNQWEDEEIKKWLVFFKSRTDNVLPTFYWIYRGIDECYEER